MEDNVSFTLRLVNAGRQLDDPGLPAVIVSIPQGSQPAKVEIHLFVGYNIGIIIPECVSYMLSYFLNQPP